MKRRSFIKTSAAGLVAPTALVSNNSKPIKNRMGKPIVISTWNHGLPANDAAMAILRQNGSALDAVEAGVRVPEADPESQSVGYGGRPDEDGHVTLDACIMDSFGNAGAVAFLKDIKHPISVARKVMDKQIT